MSHTTELFMRVYNDQSGDYFEIRPDRDGLGLVEVVAFNDEKPVGHLLFTDEEALKVAAAMAVVVRQSL